MRALIRRWNFSGVQAARSIASMFFSETLLTRCPASSNSICSRDPSTRTSRSIPRTPFGRARRRSKPGQGRRNSAPPTRMRARTSRRRLAGHPGHRHYLARSRRQRPRAIEFRDAIRAGQGEVPAGRPGGAHPPARAQQSPGQQRNGSSIVTKVLYVEDNDDNVFMLKMRLELLGDFEVLMAEDGEKGCAMAVTEGPDIILLETQIPP